MNEALLLVKNDFLQNWNRWITHSKMKLGIWIALFDLGLILFSWRYRSSFLLHMSFTEKAIFYIFLTFTMSLSNSLTQVIRGLYQNGEYEFLKFSGIRTRQFLYAILLKRMLLQTVNHLPYVVILSFGLNGWLTVYNVLGLLTIRIVVGLFTLLIAIQIAAMLIQHPYWLAVVEFFGVFFSLLFIGVFFFMVFKGYHGAPWLMQWLANHFLIIIGIMLLLFLYSLWMMAFRMEKLEKRFVVSRMNGKQKTLKIIRRRTVQFSDRLFQNIVKKDLFLNFTPAMVVRISILVTFFIAMLVAFDSPLKDALPKPISTLLVLPNAALYVIFWGVIVALLEPATTLYQMEGRGLGVYRQFAVDVRLIMGAKSVSSMVMFIPAYL